MLKIWILDSWFGGHYALLDIKSHFPQYEYEGYFDHANAPYGDKTGEEIFELSEIGCHNLWDKWCDLILIACNTICAETLRKLQKAYPEKKVLWCVIPSVEVAVEISAERIGLIGTQFTVHSHKYKQEIRKLSSHHKLFENATPELVKYIESGKATHENCLAYLDQHIEKLLAHKIDTLILGCTHYSIFYEYISWKYKNLKIVDSARTQTIKLWEYLQNHKEFLEK